jgi:hypothetical protein
VKSKRGSQVSEDDDDDDDDVDDDDDEIEMNETRVRSMR